MSDNEFTGNEAGHKLHELKQESYLLTDLATQLSEKIDELEKANNILERMSVVGELVSTLIHDIKNPLSVIKMGIDLMELTRSKDDQKFGEKIDMLKSAHDTIMEQISDVLTYIKTGKLTFRIANITTIISRATHMVTFPEKINVDTQVDSVEINCDAMKLQVVVANILKNAVEAMGDSGDIKIRTTNNENLVIEIENSGPEIPVHVKERMFDPMFTTKKMGTGLGLSSCRKIIQQHNGRIQVRTKPTCFVITLPKSK